jgi:ligand-binding SRPBCC domain-containing protein
MYRRPRDGDRHGDALQARTAGRTRRQSPPQPGAFVYRSLIQHPADEVFAWHERPDALRALLPSSPWARVDRRSGSVRDGDWVLLSFGIGPFRVRWEARHFGYVAGRQFCDEQVRGPLVLWRHTHRMAPCGPARCLYEDRVEYVVPGGALAQRLAHPILQRLLRRAFAHRHRVVRDALSGGQRGAATGLRLESVH